MLVFGIWPICSFFFFFFMRVSEEVEEVEEFEGVIGLATDSWRRGMPLATVAAYFSHD